MSDLVLRGVTLGDGAHADIFVHDGLLVDAAPTGATVVDADGLVALPGLVDPHCHLREPGTAPLPETIASGTAAAARGGYTAVAAMPNTTPACDDPDKVAWLLRRGKRASAQVVPIGAVTQGRDGWHLADLPGMLAAGVRLFSDDGAAVATADLLSWALQTAGPAGGVVADHCQHPALAGPRAWCADGQGDEGWPAVAETSIVERDVQAAADTGWPVHLCHLSCAESVDVVRWAKHRGAPVTAEVTPHHLLLTSDLLRGGDARFKVNPPLRSPADAEALRAGLADGTIDMIGTDHAPHLAADKAKPLPLASPGMTGLEQALAVAIDVMVNTGRIGWSDVTRLMSSAPSRLLKLDGQGRPLRPGNPANIVLIDPTRRAKVAADQTASLSRNNPYEGMDLPDPVAMTIWAGRVTYEQNER